MNWQSISFDWNQARAFLATAEEGSLSSAAKALGQTQPTLSRQVSALERELGVTLFERIGRSLTLTDAGIDLLEHFKAMGEAASRASLAASGQSQDVSGLVRITATNMFATYHLPPILKKIRTIAPGIEIELVTSNEVQDLMRREADIAVRHARPEQPDLIGKLIGETTGHLYASREFLDLHGRPRPSDDLSKLDFVGFETAETMLPVFQEIGLNLTRDNFKISSASGTVMLELVKMGLGITVLSRNDADMWPQLEQVFPELDPFPIPIWLVTHRELRTSKRIRVVFDLLAESYPRSQTPEINERWNP